MCKLLATIWISVLFCSCQNKVDNSAGADSMLSMNADSSQVKSGSVDHGAMVQQMESMDKMMVDDLGPADTGYDGRFIDLMIPHHEGAVMMAKDAIGKAQHPELKKLCQDIIQSQNREIELMKQWREAWYKR